MSSTALSQKTTDRSTTAEPVETVTVLCHALDEASVRYCHWKSNNALDRSARADNDLDLLIDRADSLRLAAVLSRCGFKPATAPRVKQMSGVQDYFAYDSLADRFVHVHAHFQLIAGHDLSKNFRLGIEDAYLESASPRGIFKVPAPEFEFLVFVIRMVLKHCVWDAMLTGEGRLKPSEQRELEFLQGQIDQAQVNRLLERYLPYIDLSLFWSCVQALDAGASVWSRLKAGQRLQKRLEAHGRRGTVGDAVLRLRRRATSRLRRYLRRPPMKYSLASGGLTIAVVGGDGAGKSTAIESLSAWLSEYFPVVNAHLGKPAWSPLTRLVRGVLKLGHVFWLYGAETTVRETLAERSRVSPGYPWLIREVCRARDRYRTYVRARKQALNGGIVIFDRFPLGQVRLMDGPLVRCFVHAVAASPGASQFLCPRMQHGFAKFLAAREERYYKAIVQPDLLIVLRLNPALAVQRKPDEREDDVRERSAEIWNVNWNGTSAHLVDAAKSRTEVLAELKKLIWAHL